MANVMLTPEKPTYDGSDWHFDAQLNERICAIALYCNEAENITKPGVAFHTRANAESMEMHTYGDADEFPDIYGLSDEDQGGQVLGKVTIGQGRLVVWPNVFCHQFLRFELEDKTKQGHVKFLALCLVDPATPVISSAMFLLNKNTAVGWATSTAAYLPKSRRSCTRS